MFLWQNFWVAFMLSKEFDYERFEKGLGQRKCKSRPHLPDCGSMGVPQTPRIYRSCLFSLFRPLSEPFCLSFLQKALHCPGILGAR